MSDEIKIEVPVPPSAPAQPRDPVLDIRLRPDVEPDDDLTVDALDDSETVRDSRADQRWVVLIAAVSVVALALAVVALRRSDAQTEVAVGSTTTTTLPAPPAFSAEVFEMIAPSLVLIQTAAASDDEGESSGDGEFGDGESGDVEPDRTDRGLGTGFVVNGDGSILTSLHVVDNAEQVVVTFADGVSGPASVVFGDPANDIAILLADASPSVIVPAVLGNPAQMRVGDEAYAVGNPLGLVGSMSSGVISGFDRSIPLPDEEGILDGLIQFDAAVNPGNSGGPLLNRNGEVIGVVTALANPTDQAFSAGIGFAVTITGALGGDGVGPAQ